MSDESDIVNFFDGINFEGFRTEQVDPDAHQSDPHLLQVQVPILPPDIEHDGCSSSITNTSSENSNTTSNNDVDDDELKAAGGGGGGGSEGGGLLLDEIQQHLDDLKAGLPKYLHRPRLTSKKAEQNFLNEKGAYFLMQCIHNGEEAFGASLLKLESLKAVEDLPRIAVNDVQLAVYYPPPPLKHGTKKRRFKEGYDEIIPNSPCFLLLIGVPIKLGSQERSGLNLSHPEEFVYRDPVSLFQARVQVKTGRNLLKGIRAVAFQQYKYLSEFDHVLLGEFGNDCDLLNHLVLKSFCEHDLVETETEKYRNFKNDKDGEDDGRKKRVTRGGGSSHSKRRSNKDAVDRLIKSCIDLLKKKLTQPDLFDEADSKKLFRKLAKLCNKSDGNFRLPSVEELACSGVDDCDDDSEDEKSGVEDAIRKFRNISLGASDS